MSGHHKYRSILSFWGILLLGVLVAAVLFYPEKDAYASLSEHFPQAEDHLLIVAHADIRSKTIRKRLDGWLSYIEEKDLPVNLLVKTVGSKPYVANSSHYAPWSGEELHLHKNNFKVIDGSEVVYAGRIFEQSGHMETFLREHLGVAPSFDVRDVAMAGQNITETLFGAQDSAAHVVALFENVCNTCVSGQTLNQLDLLSQQYPDWLFEFWVFEDYAAEDLERFARQHDFSIPIQPMAEEIKSFWTGLDRGETARHPLNGLILFIDTTRTIRYLGNAGQFNELKDLLAIQAQHTPQTQK